MRKKLQYLASMLDELEVGLQRLHALWSLAPPPAPELAIQYLLRDLEEVKSGLR